MDERTRTEIEQQTEDLKASIASIAEEAMDVAHGYGTAYEDRPLAHHPVWGDEWQTLAWQERHAGIETGPPIAPYETDERWQTMDRWLSETRTASEAVAQDHLARNRGEIPWVDTVDQLTPAAHAAFERQERLARMQQVTQDAAQRAPQQATQEHHISYGR